MRKVKPIWILLKQETVSGSGISWDICKSAPRSRQITKPAPTTLLQAGCPSCRPTNSVKALLNMCKRNKNNLQLEYCTGFQFHDHLNANVLLDATMSTCHVACRCPWRRTAVCAKSGISWFIIPAKARDYVFTGVGLSVCLFVCYHDN